MEELKNIKVDLIKPSKIIDKNNSNDIDNFFLTLGLIYNDLKGLIIFYRHCKEKYVIEKDDEGLTFKNGELAGLQLQIHRLMIGLVKEAIKFIGKKQSIINSLPFKLIEKEIDKKELTYWKEICKIAFSGFNKNDASFLFKITTVRNDVSFHYDDKEIMRDWFIEKFYNEEKNETNENCCYVNNFQMKSSRFFYCDAIIEKYLLNQLRPSQDINHLKDIDEMASKLKKSISFLMDSYISHKKKQNKNP